jgi:MscS family membrane protein
MSSELIDFAVSFFILYVVMLLAAWLLEVVLIKIARKVPSEYSEIFLRSIRPQIRLILLFISLKFAITRLTSPPVNVKLALDRLFFALIILFIVVVLWKLIDVVVLWYKDLSGKSGKEDHNEAALLLAERSAKILVISISIILVLDNYGVQVSALVTTLGIGGLAISLAAQDTLSNMVSGIILVIDRPFRIGDRVEVQGVGLNVEGEVVDIGLRSTRIRTYDNQMVIVPNSNISKNQVINHTFPDPRSRVQVDIGVVQGTDLGTVREVIIRAVRSVEDVLVDGPVDVILVDFKENKMSLRIRWWVESSDASRLELEKIHECIYLALKEAKIEIA